MHQNNSFYLIHYIFNKINMHRFNLLLSFALPIMMIFSSCEKATLDDPDLEEEETIELEFSIKNLGSDESNTDKQGYDEYNFLGFGYDITGKYAHISSMREAVINTPSFIIEHTGRFTNIRILSSTFREIYSANAAQFTKDLTNIFLQQFQPHNFSYFKGNITHSFPETEVNSSQYVYGRYELEMKNRRLLLNASNQLLEPFVTESFKSDRESLSAAEIIEKYGTHILISLYTGAKLSIDYQAEYRGEHGQQASENSFKIGLLTYFELPPSIFWPSDFNSIKGISNPAIVLEAIGGDPSKIKIDEKTGETFVATKEWQESITEHNDRFVYLDGLDNLMPISDLIADADKKQEVEIYINEYIKANEVTVD